MARRFTRTAVALIAASLVFTPALTGCASLEGIIEQATGGEVNVSIGSLPDGWPSDVPVADGDIVGGGVIKNDGEPAWNVTINSSDPDVFAQVAAQLEGAGFTQTENPAQESVKGVNGGLFSNDSHMVIVAVSGSESTFVVNYTVTAIEAP